MNEMVAMRIDEALQRGAKPFLERVCTNLNAVSSLSDAAGNKKTSDTLVEVHNLVVFATNTRRCVN